MPKNGLLQQWGWANMEELLQCPVCLDIPAVGNVEQCRHGHHICVNCKTKVESCPLCKCDFHGTRNFVVEELILHYEVLKNTMLLNDLVSETKSKKKKAAASIPVHHSVPRRKLNTPNASRGVFPCRAGDCDSVYPISRLLNHVRTCHADILTESEVDFTDTYSQIFDVSFKYKKSINQNCYIIFVRGMGLLYLTIEILRSGHLAVIVRMGMKYARAQEFIASIDLFSETTTYSYITRPISIKDNIENILQRKCCYTLNKTQLKNICVNKKFSCKIRLSRFNALDAPRLTTPNVEQINIVAGIRASLVLEERDKKLLKELEVCGKKQPNTNERGNSSRNSQTSSIQNEIREIQYVLRMFSGSIPNKQENGLSNNDNASLQPRGPVTPPPTVPTTARTEPVAGRRRNKRRRNRATRNNV